MTLRKAGSWQLELQLNLSCLQRWPPKKEPMHRIRWQAVPGCARLCQVHRPLMRDMSCREWEGDWDRGWLGSRSWEIWPPDGEQLDAERLTASPWSWSKQSPEASKSCLVLLPLDSVLVDVHEGNTLSQWSPFNVNLVDNLGICQHSNAYKLTHCYSQYICVWTF